MTYQINRGVYSQAPYFLWQQPRPEPVYHHPLMRAFYQREFRVFQESRTLAGFLRELGKKIWSSWKFYVGPLFTLPLLMLPWTFRDRRIRFPLLAGALLLLATAVETWTSPHYLAAATGLLYLALMQCMRHLRLWSWRCRPFGAAIVRAIPAICCALIVLRVAAVASGPYRVTMAARQPGARCNFAKVTGFTWATHRHRQLRSRARSGSRMGL